MTAQLFADDRTGATFSPCRKWRYVLWRRWDDSKPACNFLMLNPSTADETLPDNTVTRCKLFAMDWGYGSLIVTNLFAWRATDPDEMKAAADPIGPENDRHILEVATWCEIVVFAHGVHGQHKLRNGIVHAMFQRHGLEPKMRHLGLTKGGYPKHPLYLKKTLKPLPFQQGEFHAT